jgi:tRNA pseudouridine55 synthase
MKEILLVDKPKGISSFDVIRILRKKLKIKKMGHAGTLDPAATGLLIIGVGKGTKKLKKFLKLPKVYIMEVLLGKRTETGDLEGKVLEETEVKEINIKKLKEVLKNLEGEIKLKVPLYSAVKVSGTPLYKLARKGVKVEPPLKKMKIYRLKLLGHWPKNKKYILKIEMKCGSGTYARSVAEEIGRKLGLPATLSNLRRTKIGQFNVKDAIKLKRI